MKPTVSVTTVGAAVEARRPASSDRASRTAGRRTDTSAPVSAFSSVDLPTFVYPASATDGVSEPLATLAAPCGDAATPCAIRVFRELDAGARDAAVDLELRLARAARADAAAEALEVLPEAPHARQLYSSWASSTWSLPSAVWACSAKMSRMTRGAIDDAHLSVSSSTRCCAGVSSSSQTTTSASTCVGERLQLLQLAGPEVRARVRSEPVLHDPPDPVDRRRCGAVPSISSSLGPRRRNAGRPDGHDHRGARARRRG